MCNWHLTGYSKEGEETQTVDSPGLDKFKLFWSLALWHCFLIPNHSAAINHLGLSLLTLTFPFYCNNFFCSFSMCCTTASSLHLSLNPNKPPASFLRYWFFIPSISMCSYSTCSRLNKSLLDKDDTLLFQRRLTDALYHGINVCCLRNTSGPSEDCICLLPLSNHTSGT